MNRINAPSPMFELWRGIGTLVWAIVQSMLATLTPFLTFLVFAVNFWCIQRYLPEVTGAWYQATHLDIYLVAFLVALLKVVATATK